MGRIPKKTFFQRRHSHGQETHEKMLNITDYQRNPNQNHMVLLHNSDNGYRPKSTSNKCGEGVEKKESSYTVGGNVNWCSHYGEQNRSSLNN